MTDEESRNTPAPPADVSSNSVDLERDETTAEGLDRNWNELVQELRVTQTGIQMLGGFLLVLPFQNRFPELGPELRLLFLVAFSSAALSVFFVLSPVAMHRALFRTRRKDTLVSVGNRLAQIGLGLLALTMVCVVALTFGVVISEGAALIAGLLAAGIAATLLWGLAGLVAVRKPKDQPYSARAEDL
ncbi:MAG: DUF6328 family protein [bacterium]|nr:DUF6328 family protein [bacterium]